MLAPVMHVLALTSIVRERVLPVAGKVNFSVNPKVNPTDVVEEMRRHGNNLGGEQSGHVIFLDHNHTGDGLLTALQVLAVMRREQRPLSEVAGGIERFPQVLLNFPVAEKKPLESLAGFQRQLARIEASLGDRGRVLIRYSGTEQKARVRSKAKTKCAWRSWRRSSQMA